MEISTPYWWNKMPFARLVLALTGGILTEVTYGFGFEILFPVFIIAISGLLGYSFLAIRIRYRYSFTSGVFITIVIASAGCLITWHQDPANNPDHLLHHYRPANYTIVSLTEPLVEKANSYKALAEVKAVGDSTCLPVAGKIIIYFDKDSLSAFPVYGSRIIFKKNIQMIRSSGNPGSFDYKKYCYYQGITHQVYLQNKDYSILPGKNISPFKAFIFHCRKWTIHTIKKYIPGEKEQGLAQALLIGYKDDLDKNLVQSYSNTGVVHVIAISGLHLGLIYTILLLLTKPMHKLKLPRLVIIISALWIFSIIAGAQPSVLRSALMFSCIAFGEVISRKGSVFNTLALSAFILLCYNPYWLWDVGFQLSYAAVLSILIFYRRIYNWFYFSNKFLDMVWKLNAVTISAQLLTLPLSIYHFHQVPTLFLFSNLVAVPLSSAILIGEIILCVFFFIPPAAHFIGNMLHWLIYIMNTFIEQFDNIGFAVWKNLSVSIIQSILLTVVIILLSNWLIYKNKKFILYGSASLLLFFLIRASSFLDTVQQKKLVVYNVPKFSVIELIAGTESKFYSNPDLRPDHFLWNFHIQPSRIVYRLNKTHPLNIPGSFRISGKQIVFIDSSYNLRTMINKKQVDVLIISKNPTLYITGLTKCFQIGQLVIDSSVPAWKSRLLKKDCDSLRIPCYVVSENGAFVMPL